MAVEYPYVRDATLYWPLTDDDRALRGFTAVVEADVDEDPTEIGRMTGWIAMTDQAPGAIVYEADAISEYALMLAQVIEEVHALHPSVPILSSVLIDRVELDAPYRGRHLAGTIVDSLIDLFQLVPMGTIVVLQPRPTTAATHSNGTTEHQAEDLLRRAYESYGFIRWRNDLWCRHPALGSA